MISGVQGFGGNEGFPGAKGSKGEPGPYGPRGLKGKSKFKKKNRFIFLVADKYFWKTDFKLSSSRIE